MTSPSGREPVIEVQDVGYFYYKRRGTFSSEKFWALKQVSFLLNRGESLGIIGRNGVGKSTLLRLLAGITRPDRGRLVNHGVSSTLLSLQAGFLPYLTGRENALLNGMILGLRKREIKERMDEIRAFSGLEEFFDQPISSYSSGMKARLGFSIAFQMDPDVLLVDEVLGVGDEQFKNKSGEEMKKRIKSDKTVVLVTHSGPTIRELCDRAVWIEGGVSRAEGPPAQVLDEYNQYVRSQKKG